MKLRDIKSNRPKYLKQRIAVRSTQRARDAERERHASHVHRMVQQARELVTEILSQ